MMLCAEDNSGFILKSPNDGFLGYWVANFYKFWNWMTLLGEELAVTKWLISQKWQSVRIFLS